MLERSALTLSYKIELENLKMALLISAMHLTFDQLISFIKM